MAPAGRRESGGHAVPDIGILDAILIYDRQSIAARALDSHIIRVPCSLHNLLGFCTAGEDQFLATLSQSIPHSLSPVHTSQNFGSGE